MVHRLKFLFVIELKEECSNSKDDHNGTKQHVVDRHMTVLEPNRNGR